MDACISYFDQVDALLESYNECPIYDAVFTEASDEDAVANAETEEKAVSLLQKAINVMKSIIQKIKDILNTIVSWVKADNAEISEYKKFCQQIKQNPALKDKKVTLRDYRQVIAEYNKELGEAENRYRSMKDEEAANRPSFIDDIKRDLAATAKKAAAIATSVGGTFTLETALEYARQNTKNAALVQTIIDKDFLILNALEKELGSKQIKHFKWKVKVLNSKSRFLRNILGGRMEQSKTLKDTVADTFKSVRSVISGTKGLIANKDTRDAGKLVAGIAKDVGKEVAHETYTSHKYAKDAQRKLDDSAEQVLGWRVNKKNSHYANREADLLAPKQAQERHEKAIADREVAAKAKAEKKAAKKQAKADKKRAKRESANMESGEFSLDMIDDLSAFTE